MNGDFLVSLPSPNSKRFSIFKLTFCVVLIMCSSTTRNSIDFLSLLLLAGRLLTRRWQLLIKILARVSLTNVFVRKKKSPCIFYTCDFFCWFLFHLLLLIFYAHKKRRLVINYFQNRLFRSVMRTSTSFRMSRVYMIFLDIFLMDGAKHAKSNWKSSQQVWPFNLERNSPKKELLKKLRICQTFSSLSSIWGLMILTPCFHKTKSKMYTGWFKWNITYFIIHR